MQGIMPPSLDTILAAAANYEAGVIKEIDKQLQRSSSTDPSDNELAVLSSATGVDEDELRYFLSFIAFLYLQTSDLADEEVLPTLVAFLEENIDSDEVGPLAEKLHSLLSHRDVQGNATKRARLRDGLLPNITGLANFVDLRSDFERDDSGDLTGRLGESVTIVQLGIRTNSAKQNERELLLQLDEKSLDKLQETIDEIRKKLSILSNDDV